MTQYWEPGTNYPAGSVVKYEGSHPPEHSSRRYSMSLFIGHRYKIIQPHTSQSDWTPPQTPALWGGLDDHDDGESQQHHHSQPEKPSYEAPPPGEPINILHEERKKHWYNLDDERKKELEIGGGLLAGASLLAGGYLAFKHHEKNEEEVMKKAQMWSLQNWVKDAEARTDVFYRHGPRSPATWILNHGKEIPQGAIEVGQEHSWKLYICRAFYEGGIQIGKASDVFQKGAVIGYKHEEIQLGTYEILVGDMNGLRWVDASGVLDVSHLGYKPVEGG
ncbi:hypothetical protein B0H10DRAFT_2229874 [Mycena sp. CBHHK59/15]|nr:hypothetical protein B0H10DRAFT_2229874 [Mycena sp. CBHHK59/15]